MNKSKWSKIRDSIFVKRIELCADYVYKLVEETIEFVDNGVESWMNKNTSNDDKIYMIVKFDGAYVKYIKT